MTVNELKSIGEFTVEEWKNRSYYKKTNRIFGGKKVRIYTFRYDDLLDRLFVTCDDWEENEIYEVSDPDSFLLTLANTRKSYIEFKRIDNRRFCIFNYVLVC